MKLLVFNIWELIVHILLVVRVGRHAILFSSASLAIIISFNMWGSEMFEITALTVGLEVTTWIITYFLFTLLYQS